MHNWVCYIHETLLQTVCKFVPGKDNPADYGTQDLTPLQLYQHSSWWVEPPWLSEENSNWPTESPTLTNEPLEERATQALIIAEDSNNLWDLIYKYSSLTRLLRITCICIRAVRKFKGSSTTPASTPITPYELDSAKSFWIKKIQQVAFTQEIKMIAEGKLLPKTNPLLRLTPYLDSTGLLRVGGRL